MLIAGVIVSIPQLRGEERALQIAIESNLDKVFDELASHQERGKLPSVEWARTYLNNPVIEQKLYLPSVFGVEDLWYNPTAPVVGS